MWMLRKPFEELCGHTNHESEKIEVLSRDCREKKKKGRGVKGATKESAYGPHSQGITRPSASISFIREAMMGCEGKMIRMTSFE